MARVVPPAWSPVVSKTIGSGLRGLTSPARTVLALEAALGDRFDAPTVAGVDSGTTALRMAMTAAGRVGRTAIALPAWGCFDLATAADGADVPVHLYDVDPTTLGPAWPSFEAALANGVAAVVVVHPFGLAVDVERARRLAHAAGVLLIEDAAQAAGATINGRPLGSFGDWSILSFGRGKGLTGGGGGALLTRVSGDVHPNPLGPPLPGSRALVVLVALLVASRPSIYGILAGLPFLGLGETPYHRPHRPGRIAGAAAGAVLDTLDRLDAAGRERTVAALRLAARARRRDPATVATVLAGSRPTYLRLPLLLSGGRDRLGGAARLGVARGYPKALVDLDGFGPRIQNPADDFAGARRLACELVTLPTHRWVSETDLIALERWLDQTIGQVT